MRMRSVSRHRGVIRLLDWYESAESFILILERPENSIDLFDYIRECGCVPERDAKVVFRQVVAAIHHVHACGVVHRDIKDENVVINRDNGECKIIDFGCGTFLKTRPYTDFSGTPEFYPPEWFNQRCYGGRTSAVWSLGILLFDMLCGEIPFKTKSQICSGIFEFKGPVSREAKHLIRWMLSFDPASRPLFTQILCHPWLMGISLSRSLN